jgi:predicted unusual protein kinase regulating ubiquinone biosynthesis (AarF/ABC1/UbiB family)
VDFGIFGEVSPEQQRVLIGYQESLVRGRFRQSARHYIHLCTPTAGTRMAALEDDLTALLEQWKHALSDPELPLEQRHLAVWQSKVVRLLRHHRVRTPRNLLLVWRAWMFLDSATLRFPFHFDVLEAQVRFFHRRRIRQSVARLGPDAARDEILVLTAQSHEAARNAQTLSGRTVEIAGRRLRDTQSVRAATRSERQLGVALLTLSLTVLAAGLSADQLKPIVSWLMDAAGR